MDDLKIAPSPSYAREMIGDRIKEHASTLNRQVEILEAGCGRKWNIDLDGVTYRLTGVDLDPDALAYRENVVRDLDVAIVGDLRTVDLPADAYDIVFSAFVLEHISGAEAVLDRLVSALKPGGLLVLRVPDGDSVYAYLARFLPFWTHVLYKRIADHDPQAGKPGHPPYRVVYDKIVSRNGLHEFFGRRGLTIVDEVGTNPHLDGKGMIGTVGMMGQKAIAKLSAGRLDGSHSNLSIVISRP
jgi:SAM-dependent methyltransferase